MNKQKLRIHCIQHVDFEGIGYIESWAKNNNHELTYSLLYKQEEFPEQIDFDWLIVMGGPMNIYEDDKYPWLTGEKQFIKESINSDKTVLGFCLGSQLIADVLGAKVKRNKDVEIGWFPVNLTDFGKSHKIFQDLNFDNPVFHWHGDTFDIPAKCEHIAYSKACTHQAFTYKDKVIGFQFHLEVTPYSLANMVENGKDELIRSEYVQSQSDITGNSQYINPCNEILTEILNRLSKQSV